ncbi:MAG: hypothetical protein HY925_06370 [Elusimicrobia bacterium]|nr:hypothetical protein [Elusimicrobiota bacterium]
MGIASALAVAVLAAVGSLAEQASPRSLVDLGQGIVVSQEWLGEQLAARSVASQEEGVLLLPDLLSFSYQDRTWPNANRVVLTYRFSTYAFESGTELPDHSVQYNQYAANARLTGARLIALVGQSFRWRPLLIPVPVEHCGLGQNETYVHFASRTTPAGGFALLAAARLSLKTPGGTNVGKLVKCTN